jgi:hypothetical protein
MTISSASDPSEATFIAWLNETALWITGLCAERNSDLGRTIGTITTVCADISGASKASPCSITATAHGLMTSGTEEVLIWDVSGMTELNDTEYTATYVNANSVTIGIDTSSDYTTYTSGGYISKRIYDTLATYMYAPAQTGWIVDGHTRQPVHLKHEDNLIEYDPLMHDQPSEFYIDGSNNVCFFVYPDAAYTVKIPYWQLPTAITATTDTVPFNGLMDNVFIEALAWRALNRDEYDASTELQWQGVLLERADRVIKMRRSMKASVGLK